MATMLPAKSKTRSVTVSPCAMATSIVEVVRVGLGTSEAKMGEASVPTCAAWSRVEGWLSDLRVATGLVTDEEGAPGQAEPSKLNS